MQPTAHTVLDPTKVPIEALRSWKVNVMGPVLAARHVIPHMEQRGGGTFAVTVLAASAAGLNTGPTSFDYATSKHAALGVAEWLAINHGPTIAVRAICPTIVDTPMAPDFGQVMFQPLTVDDVVDGEVDGIENGGFLIPVGPGVVEAFQAKAGDYDGFLGNRKSGRSARVAEAVRPDMPA